MVQVTKNLKGSTLVEVIVATLIILVGFLMFSGFVTQILASRPATEEIKTIAVLPELMRQNSFENNNYLHKICPQCELAISPYQGTEIPAIQYTLRSTGTGKNALVFYKIVPGSCTDSLFQD